MPIFKDRFYNFNKRRVLKRIKRVFNGMWQAKRIHRLEYKPAQEVVIVYFTDDSAPYKINVRMKCDLEFIEAVTRSMCMLMY